MGHTEPEDTIITDIVSGEKRPLVLGRRSPAIGQAEAGLWRIALDTSHFSFEAYGSTAAQAINAFDALIDAHVTQTGADPDWAEAVKTEVVPYEVHAGVGIRDHDVIVKEIA